jgi:hypothetical protein
MPAQPVDLLRYWILRQAKDGGAWFEERLSALGQGASERELHTVMGLIPRLLGKADLSLTAEEIDQADDAHPGWRPDRWSIDGGARVLALVVYRGERPFVETFKDLRRTADAGELIALYRGLPLYPDPRNSSSQSLEFEVGEGLRSNMRAVFEAIAHDNPYPYTQFDEHRWNHMVLKALFIGSRLAPIVGLDERANPELAHTLLDYAHERWAAGRTVSPELWRCVGPFAAKVQAFDDLERALSGTAVERAAATLALAANPSPQARAILASTPDAVSLIAEGHASWDTLSKSEAT